MSDQLIIGVAIGWFLGALAMWANFLFAGLIITREEYEARRRKK